MWDTYLLLVSIQTGEATVDISIEAQKSKIQYHSQKYHEGLYILVQRYALPSMLSFVQCTVAIKRKQLICLPTDEQIMKYDT